MVGVVLHSLPRNLQMYEPMFAQIRSNDGGDELRGLQLPSMTGVYP